MARMKEYKMLLDNLEFQDANECPVVTAKKKYEDNLMHEVYLEEIRLKKQKELEDNLKSMVLGMFLGLIVSVLIIGVTQ